MSKLQLRPEAESLRKKGYSFQEISVQLDVSKSTVAGWCRDVHLSSTALSRLDRHVGDGRMKGRLMGAQMNKQMREQRVCFAEQWADNQIRTWNARDLLLVGIGLYWGEGAKARKLNFTNSDPKLLVFIKKWFEKSLGTSSDDFLVRIYINESHRDRYEKVKKFWARTLKISARQFYEPTFLKTKLQKVYENRETYYGVVSLRLRKSTDLQYRILGLIKAVSNAGVAQVVRAQHS